MRISLSGMQENMSWHVKNQSAKGTEMTDSMKTWQKSEFL